MKNDGAHPIQVLIPFSIWLAKFAYNLEENEVNSLPHEYITNDKKSVPGFEDLAKRKYLAGIYLSIDGVVEVPRRRVAIQFVRPR